MKHFTFLKSLLLLCALVVGSNVSWATERTVSFTYSSSSDNWTDAITGNSWGTAYVQHRWTATCSDQSTVIYFGGVLAKQSSNLAMRYASSRAGEMLGNIDPSYDSQKTWAGNIPSEAVGAIPGRIKTISVKLAGTTSRGVYIYAGTSQIVGDSQDPTATDYYVVKSSKKTSQNSSETYADNTNYRYFAITGGHSSYSSVTEVTITYEEDESTKYTLSSAVSPANSGTVTLGSTSLAEGGTTNIEASAASGYAFSSWTVTGAGASVENPSAASTTFTMGTEDATVTANFTEVNYWVVTYDYNDGVTANEDVQVLKTDAASYTLKAAPSRENYNFTGWKIGETTYNAGAAYVPTGNVTVQAQWEFDGTLITYNKSGKSDIATGAKYILVGKKSDVYYFAVDDIADKHLFFSGSSVTNAYSSITNDKATIVDEEPLVLTLEETTDGWYLKNSTKKLGMTGDKQMNWDSGDMTWELGGSETVPTFSATNGNSDYILLFNNSTTPPRFNGYTGTSTSVVNAYFYRLDDGKDVYTLTLNFNDGATANGTHRVLEGAAYTLTTPTREGYTFAGWNTAENGTGTTYAEGLYTMPASATTLYAQWNNVKANIAATKEWITYSSPFNLDFSSAIDGLEGAYTITGHSKGATTLTATKVAGTVKAGTGLLLHATTVDNTNAQVIVIPVAESGTEQTENMLVGVTVATTVNPTEGTNTNLGLKNGSFVPYSDAGTLAAGKAYLQIPTADMPSNGAKLTIIFGGDGETTNINTLDSRLSSLDQKAPRYNMAGQRVSDSYKGIVIVNGKKYIRK